MKNVVILGAAGRTGRYILRALNPDEGLHVTAFDVRPDTDLMAQQPRNYQLMPLEARQEICSRMAE